MKQFLSQNSENGRLELVVDTTLFPIDVAMKAAYVMLDRAYFFFYTTSEGLLVQITPKANQKHDSEYFAHEYADELLAYSLRVKVETDNKVIRETIVRRALGSYADLPNFTHVEGNVSSQIDFNKDIDEILREIENDPNLSIDEDEINRILSEIEAETQSLKKPTLDPNKLKDVKKNFQRK